MTLHYFAVRVEEHRLVAAEIDSSAAAALLDAAHPLLLGTAEDLAKVAQRLKRPLVIIARAEPRRVSAAPRTAPGSFPAHPGAAASGPVAAVSQPAARGLFGTSWGEERTRTTARVA